MRNSTPALPVMLDHVTAFVAVSIIVNVNYYGVFTISCIYHYLTSSCAYYARTTHTLHAPHTPTSIGDVSLMHLFALYQSTVKDGIFRKESVRILVKDDTIVVR